MGLYLGIDTSNYTTSVAVFDGKRMLQQKRLLPVKEGERGLRQSDAVFHHTKAYPELVNELFKDINGEITAVGASVAPTTQKGSYMPCFLVGEGFGAALCDVLGVPFSRFSHQHGHIAAALYSAGKTELFNESFIAFHVSGGTTDAVLCEPSENGICVTPLASSNDLKAGQAIDRIGVKMGLKFPAGAELEKLALQSSETYKNKIKLYNGDCSLSGVENKCVKMLDDGESNADVAKFLLTYIADTISTMADAALEKYGKLPLVFAGGVMSDKIIRDIITSRFEAYFAAPEYSCDNAAGIAYLTYRNNEG